MWAFNKHPGAALEIGTGSLGHFSGPSQVSRVTQVNSALVPSDLSLVILSLMTTCTKPSSSHGFCSQRSREHSHDH